MILAFALVLLAMPTTTSWSAAEGSRLELCGRVDELEPPTQTRPGHITIAGRSLAIAPLPPTSGLPSARDERRFVGKGACLTRQVNEHGQLEPDITFGLGLWELGTMCGFANRVEPPRTNASGLVQLGGDRTGGFELIVPAGSTVSLQPGSEACAATSLDDRGRAIATSVWPGIAQAQPGTAESPATTPVAELPSTTMGGPLLAAVAIAGGLSLLILAKARR
jgi:hypothetical protein